MFILTVTCLLTATPSLCHGVTIGSIQPPWEKFKFALNVVTYFVRFCGQKRQHADLQKQTNYAADFEAAYRGGLRGRLICCWFLLPLV